MSWVWGVRLSLSDATSSFSRCLSGACSALTSRDFPAALRRACESQWLVSGQLSHVFHPFEGKFGLHPCPAPQNGCLAYAISCDAPW